MHGQVRQSDRKHRLFRRRRETDRSDGRQRDPDETAEREQGSPNITQALRAQQTHEPYEGPGSDQCQAGAQR